MLIQANHAVAPGMLHKHLVCTLKDFGGREQFAVLSTVNHAVFYMNAYRGPYAISNNHLPLHALHSKRH